MENIDRNFEVEKTFGLGVLLKLTKKNVQGIKISTHGKKFVSNVSIGKLSQAVDTTFKTYNILLKCR